MPDAERGFSVYDFMSRIRYSETAADARLSLVGIMNYFQDCSTFHSEDAGVGLSFYEKEQKTWLLSSWQIVIERRPALGETVRIGTWPYGYKGIYGLRNYAMYDLQGNFLVKANSCWFLMDLKEGRPLRVTEADLAPYGKGDPKLSMDYAPRKIALPEQMEEAGRFVVMRHQIDTNHHMNNAHYVDMAGEALPESGEIGEIRAEYKKAAMLGDLVVIRRGESPSGWVFSLCREDGEIFANVELKRKQDEKEKTAEG